LGCCDQLEKIHAHIELVSGSWSDRRTLLAASILIEFLG
jgi:hypothetical protein